MSEWQGRIFGELGVLRDDGERVECHACGLYFAALGRHVVLTHHLRPDEYRAIFGLNESQGLVGPAYRAILSKGAERLRRYWPEAEARLPRVRGSWPGRRMRLQARLDPSNLERWREAGRRGGARIRALSAAGQWEPTALRDPAVAARATARAHERLRELRADPAWVARWRKSVSDAHGGGPIVATCKVCGRPIEASRRDLRRGFGLLCGPVCRSESRRRATLRRWREDPEHTSIADHLKLLAPNAFADLGEREGDLVRLYYGLHDRAPLLLNELAEQFDLSSSRVGQIIQMVVAQLLGPGFVSSSVDACVICGAAIVRRGRRPRAICGKVCDLERRRRIAVERHSRGPWVRS